MTTYRDATRPAVESRARLTRVPHILIDSIAFERLQTFISLFDKEIAGLGRVKEHANGDLFITEIFLVEQSDNAAAHVDISEGAHKLALELLERGDEGERAIAEFKCRWHSHVDFAAEFSEIDDATGADFGGDYLVDIVGNKRGEFSVRLHFQKPLQITVDDLPLYVATRRSAAVERQCEDEIAAKVRRPLGRALDALAGAFGLGRRRGWPSLDEGAVVAEARRAVGLGPAPYPGAKSEAGEAAAPGGPSAAASGPDENAGEGVPTGEVEPQDPDDPEGR